MHLMPVFGASSHGSSSRAASSPTMSPASRSSWAGITLTTRGRGAAAVAEPEP